MKRAIKASALGQSRGMGWEGRGEGAGRGIYTRIQYDFISRFLTKYIYKNPLFSNKVTLKFPDRHEFGGHCSAHYAPLICKMEKKKKTCRHLPYQML